MKENNRKYGNWWNSRLSHRLQKINIIFTVLGVVISFMLSGLAVYLTYKYGESTTQIDALTKIASEQNQQIKTLEIIQKDAEEQKTISDKQVTEIKKSNDALITQTDILSRQLALLNSNQQTSNQFRKIDQKVNFNKFKITLLSINDMALSERLNVHNRNIDEELITLNKLHNLILPELTNPYVLENNAIEEGWKSLNDLTSDAIGSFTILDNRDTVRNQIISTENDTDVLNLRISMKDLNIVKNGFFLTVVLSYNKFIKKTMLPILKKEDYAFYRELEIFNH